MSRCPTCGHESKRSNEQNALMWALLNDFAEQKLWIVNDNECFMSADDWKRLLSACFRKESQRIAQGIDGGIVLLGARTSKMGKDEMNDFIAYIQAAGAEMGIKFSAPEFRTI